MYSYCANIFLPFLLYLENTRKKMSDRNVNGPNVQENGVMYYLAQIYQEHPEAPIIQVDNQHGRNYNTNHLMIILHTNLTNRTSHLAPPKKKRTS